MERVLGGIASTPAAFLLRRPAARVHGARRRLRVTPDKVERAFAPAPYVPKISEQVTCPLLALGADKSVWSWAHG